MARARNIDHVQVVLFNGTIQMNIDKVLARSGAPMSQQHPLHVGSCQRALQQGIVAEVNLTDER